MSIFMKPIIRVGSDECDPENSQKRLLINGLHWLAVCGLFCLFAVAAVHLLRVTYYVFTSMNRTTNVDYTRYLNMMWNTAHGHWFQSGIDGSYLFFHLSFSLFPWAFIFRLTDHPFALAAMQWFWVVSGGLLAAWAARKKGVPQVAVGGLLVFWIGYHFAQSGVVHEFHGAMLYYLLIPWFYLWREKRLGWLPFCLLLGVREDAGLVIVPIVLYFAIRDQWKMGYVYAGVALAYVAIAVFVLYPLINGHSLFQIRTQELNGAVRGAAIRPRLLALFWVLLPMIPFLRRGWLPLVVFVSLPLGMALASGYRFQYSLQVHYGGTVHICLALAWIEAWRLTVAKKARFWWPGAAAAYFVIITLISNGIHGYLPGWRFKPVGRQYLNARPSGEYVTYLARKVLPRDGILAASPDCAAYVAERGGFMFPESFSYLESAKVANRAELVFTTLGSIPGFFVQALRQGEWGVWFFDDRYVLIKRCTRQTEMRIFCSIWKVVPWPLLIRRPLPERTRGLRNSAS